MTFMTDQLRGLLEAESGLYSPSRWRVYLPSINDKTKVNGGGAATPSFITNKVGAIEASIRLRLAF